MTEKDIYDKRKFYKTKLEPLIHELKLQCNMEHMPMFVTVAVKNDKAGTEYASDMVLAGSGTELENNRISKLLLELNNIHQKYPDYIEKDIRVHTATFRGHQGRVLRPDRAILSGQS